MKKANGRGQGSGIAGEGAHRGRGRGRGRCPVVAAEQPPGRKQATMPAFLSQSSGQRRVTTRLTDADQVEQVVSWIGSRNYSSSFSQSQSSATTSQDTAEPHPTASPPSSKLVDVDQMSEDLFSGPLFHLALAPSITLEESEVLCPDSEIPEHPQVADVGEVPQLRGEEEEEEEEEEEDETQLPDSPRQLLSQEDEGGDDPEVTVAEEVELSSQSLGYEDMEEEEEVVDDDVTDPTWEAGHASLDSASDVEDCPAQLTAGRGRGVARGRSQATQNRPVTAMRSSLSRRIPVARGRCSAVWKFFTVTPDDRSTVACNLCNRKISRGSANSNFTTTSMIRHMKGKHEKHWAESQGQHPQSVAVAANTASCSPVLGAVDQHAHGSRPGPPKAPSSTTSTSLSQGSIQISIPQALERKRKFAPTHPHAKALTDQLSKLLALEMLPFRLVDTDAFRSLMSVAVPRYAVPSRYYFSRCAVPSLHEHVCRNISRALNNAVCGKVHLTTDAWASAFGQGRYISLTAHWVNVVEVGSDSSPGMAQVLPTPRIAGPTSLRVSASSYTSGSNRQSSSATSSSSSSSCSSGAPTVGSWKRCSTAVGKRQQAVLKLICLGEKRHTAEELWQGIREQTQLWLSPLNLQPGMVVSDNARNLVAALEIADLTHIPCLAHVLNLVVQKFLKTYPEVPQLLVKVRRLCAHFHKSSTSASALLTLQQHFGLPAHRLLCDVVTRWNSTFHMLSRLCEQRRAVVEYLQHQLPRRLATQLPHITCDDWARMTDLCEVLKNFDESTQMVSGDNAIVSVSIPLLCLLKSSLLTLKRDALQAEQLELREDFTQGDSQSILGSSSQSQFHAEEEEEEQEEMVVSSAPATEGALIPSVQRGWAEEEEEDEGSQAPAEHMELLTVGSLAHMAQFMLGCLESDRRVSRILSDVDYWVFALLDPRYKDNFSSLIPVVERPTKMMQYQNALVDKLLQNIPTGNPSTVGGSLGNPGTMTRGGTASTSNRGRATLSKAWDNFLAPRQDTHHAPQSTSRRDKCRKMVREYLADGITVFNDPSAPVNYWVSKLDTWHELSLYALEVLACPAASVLSERVFSAAGGIITDKRTRLSTDNADRLTQIKMNKAWIGPEFTAPSAES